MARPSNTEERRKQITRGLMGVMAKKGYDGASVGDIAKAAKLSSGLVHYHFKDKLEILAALAQHLAEDNRVELRRHLSTIDGPAQSLEAIVDFSLGLGRSANPDALSCWIALSGEALRHKSIGKVFEATLAELHQLVQAQIEAGVEQKVFSARVDAAAAAAGLVATIQGYFVLAGTARGLIPKGSAARTTKQMLKGLLAGKS